MSFYGQLQFDWLVVLNVDQIRYPKQAGTAFLFLQAKLTRNRKVLLRPYIAGLDHQAILAARFQCVGSGALDGRLQTTDAITIDDGLGGDGVGRTGEMPEQVGVFIRQCVGKQGYFDGGE